MKPSASRLLAGVAAALAQLGLSFECLGADEHPPKAVDVSFVPARPSPSTLPEGWHHGAFMEIFVRAYQDSNGDGHGDLRGLISRLDYLKDLGVRGLWLMPVLANADGDHGYATVDFRAIAAEYGTIADFDELIRQAHRRGIGVVMDYVINHSAAQHPLFQQALQGPENPFHDWYVWSDEAPQGWDIWGKNPWYHAAEKPWTFSGADKDRPLPPASARGFYFGTFGAHMPDFNLRRADVVEFHRSSLRFWLNRGLDGYRLDAVPHMIENSAVDWNDQPESRSLTFEFQSLIKSYPNRFVVCEATARPQDYGDPAVCGGAFAFGYVHHIVDAAMGKPESVQQVATYYAGARPTMATFVSNHDIFAGQRLMDQVRGDERRYRLAAATYLLQPGTPFIYYGEEIGQAGIEGLPGDQPIRSPMSWAGDAKTGGFTTGRPFRPMAPNAATHNVQREQRDPESILNFYKAILRLRNRWPSIARGRFEGGFAQGLAAGWQRVLGDERTLVVINYATSAVDVDVPSLPRGSVLKPLWPGFAPAAPATAGGAAHLHLAPQSLRVYQVQAAASVAH